MKRQGWELRQWGAKEEGRREEEREGKGRKGGRRVRLCWDLVTLCLQVGIFGI